MLSSTEFNKRVKEHLSKVEVKEQLGFSKEKDKIKHLSEDGIYLGKYGKKLYGHILSDNLLGDLKKHNHSKYSYIEFYREEIVKRVDGKVELHKNQKHLNSSQSMAINFFYPIIIKSFEKEAVNKLFGINGNETTIKLEVSMNDSGGGAGQTEVDCLITSDGTEHLFEVKYTEGQFGRANINKKNEIEDRKKYQAKWNGNENYKSELNLGEKRVQYDKVEELLEGEKLDIDFYFKNYQLIRNLYNAFFECKKDGKIIRKIKEGTMNCIFSNRNKTQFKEFEEFKGKVDGKYHNKVNFYSWESLANQMVDLSMDIGNKNLEEHYRRFKAIYLDF